jgi:hypothetical protein
MISRALSDDPTMAAKRDEEHLFNSGSFFLLLFQLEFKKVCTCVLHSLNALFQVQVSNYIIQKCKCYVIS